MKKEKTGKLLISNLSKKYSSSTVFALKDLDIEVNSGEVYGLLGPNGAGKSTAIRCALNFIYPTSGTITILGKDSKDYDSNVRQKVGYLSGDTAIYPKMTGKTYLQYMQDLLPIKNEKYFNKVVKKLDADLSKKICDLSRGNRQKIGLIQALMHEPEVIILDEPTSGLDPLMQEVFYELILEAKARGACIMISSHILGEVQKICDRVGIIRKGELVAERNISDMALEASQNFEIIFEGTPPLENLKKIAGVKNLSLNKNQVSLHMHGELKPLLVELAKHNVTSLNTQTLDLEEVFLEYYGDKK